MIRDAIEMLLDGKVSVYKNYDVFYRFIFSDMIMDYKKAGAIITASADQNYITYKIHDVNGKLIHIYLWEV